MRLGKINFGEEVYTTEEIDQKFAALGADVDARLAGKASLEGGKVPSDELPSYVDDVEEYASLNAFPEEGEEGKIYVAKDTNKTYRWSGTQYTKIGGDDAILTPVYSNTPTFSEWTVEPPTYEGENLVPVFGAVSYPTGWSLCKASNLKSSILTPLDGDKNATYLHWIDSEILEFTATRTRTDILGYKLGDQSDKPLAPAKDYALKSDIPDISGKANDNDVLHKSGEETAQSFKTFSTGITVGQRKTGTTHGDRTLENGLNVCASAKYAHAEGWNTTASKDGAHAEGNGSTASGQYSHAEGSLSTASGQYSHAEGSGTRAEGNYSHTTGQNTVAKGNFSSAEGKATSVFSGSVANVARDDEYSVALGEASHVEGANTKATGSASHAEGSLTWASAANSHAEGAQATASQTAAHAEGARSTAAGPASHAEGADTLADGSRAHAEGDHSVAVGTAAHAEGYYTKTTNDCEHAQGKYNVSRGTPFPFGNPGNTLHSIGFGSADNDRKNVVEVMQDGKVYVYGVGDYDGKTLSTNPKDLSFVIRGLVGRLDDVEEFVGYVPDCLTPYTRITMADGSEKFLADVEIGDKVLSPFGEDEVTGVFHGKKDAYDIWEFEDGAVVITVGRHRFWNCDLGEPLYLEAWNIGEHAVKADKTRVALVSHMHIESEYEYATLFTKTHNLYYANGFLAGNRNSTRKGVNV